MSEHLNESNFNLKLKKPLTLTVRWEDGTWFVECKELDICGSGINLVEAAKTFQDYLLATAVEHLLADERKFDETTAVRRKLTEHIEVSCIPPPKNLKVELEFEKLRLISHYFSFPVAVFFAPLDSLKRLERRKIDDDIKKRLEALEKIRAILEEVK